LRARQPIRVQQEEDDTVDFDVVTELVFPDRDAFVAGIEKLSVEVIGTDGQTFLDRSRTRACVIEEHVTAGEPTLPAPTRCPTLLRRGGGLLVGPRIRRIGERYGF
jgi:hypothetical protein